MSLIIPWPLPALLAWIGAWTVFLGLTATGAAPWMAAALGVGIGLGAGWTGQTPWRRFFIAAGFPLSLVLSGLPTGIEPWVWLLPLGGLLVLYPTKSWKDAPLFPTPKNVLEGLGSVTNLPPNAPVLDAGCGLGHGLLELHRAFPQAQLYGLELSWPLRLLCALRCPFAQVRRGNIWGENWAPYQMVYLFQRPESMPRAVDKAAKEMSPGTWLVSLEFPALPLEPTAVLRNRPDKPVWIYRLPVKSR